MNNHTFECLRLDILISIFTIFSFLLDFEPPLVVCSCLVHRETERRCWLVFLKSNFLFDLGRFCVRFMTWFGSKRQGIVPQSLNWIYMWLKHLITRWPRRHCYTRKAINQCRNVSCSVFLPVMETIVSIH